MLFELYGQLNEIPKKHRGRKVSSQTLLKLIRSRIKDKNIRFKLERNPEVLHYNASVSGMYNFFDDDRPIEITLHVSQRQRVWEVDKIHWDTLIFDVASCIGHEYVHFTQYTSCRDPFIYQHRARYISRARNPKLKIAQEYLGSRDEIEAYGYSIAAESVYSGLDHKHSEWYKLYRQAFKRDAAVLGKLESWIKKYKKRLRKEYEQIVSAGR